MQYVRIFAEATVDNPDAPSIYVDAIIDNSRTLMGRHTLFGLQGSFTDKDTDYYPFTLDSVGKVDFGRGYDKPANERYATLDLRDGPVKVGRLLMLESLNYGRQLYRMKEVTELPA
jgi:hypothetical protein